MPEYLCSASRHQHAGTTDVDVQVDLELARGATNVVTLERALRAAGFEPDTERVWRWTSNDLGAPVVVKFELLADTPEERSGVVLRFEECEALGAVNLPGTGFASRDVEMRSLAAMVDGVERTITLHTTGLAGFLLAKTAAAYSRRKPKDWYDIAFVLLHNDAGGPEAAGEVVRSRFPQGDLNGMRIALTDLAANFADSEAQGPQAYARQMVLDHEGLETRTLVADAITAVSLFHRITLDAPAA